MKKTKLSFSSVVMALGILLVVLAIGYASFLALAPKFNAIKNREILESMNSLMPEIKNSAPDGRNNVTMPSIEINKEDFIGIIKSPMYDATLPVAAAWNTSSVEKYPC